MVRIGLLSFVIFTGLNLNAQRWISEKSYIRFFSHAPIEDIEATNDAASSALDQDNGDIVFRVPITAFLFDKSLMRTHFNENYLESDKYPYCYFRGTLNKNFIKEGEGEREFVEGENQVTVTGTMDMHGVKREVTIVGTMFKQGNWMKGRAKFTVKLKDYKIKIPRALFYNIAEEIEVTIMFEYVPL